VLASAAARFPAPIPLLGYAEWLSVCVHHVLQAATEDEAEATADDDDEEEEAKQEEGFVCKTPPEGEGRGGYGAAAAECTGGVTPPEGEGRGGGDGYGAAAAECTGGVCRAGGAEEHLEDEALWREQVMSLPSRVRALAGMRTLVASCTHMHLRSTCTQEERERARARTHTHTHTHTHLDTHTNNSLRDETRRQGRRSTAHR